MQNGVTLHTPSLTLELLAQKFGDRMNFYEFFLFGYMKDNICAATRQQFKKGHFFL